MPPLSNMMITTTITDSHYNRYHDEHDTAPQDLAYFPNQEPLPFAFTWNDELPKPLGDVDHDDDDSVSCNWTVDSVGDSSYEDVAYDDDLDTDIGDGEEDWGDHGIVILESQNSLITVIENGIPDQQQPPSCKPKNSRRVRFVEGLVTQVYERPPTAPEDMCLLYYSAHELQKLLEEYVREETGVYFADGDSEIES